MTTWTYRAWDTVSARELTGQAEVDSVEDLRRELGDGVVLVDARTRSASPFAAVRSRLAGRKVPPAELTDVFAQLSSLLRAGVSLTTALDVVAGQHRRHRSGRVLEEIAQQVVRGDSVTEAFGAQLAAIGELPAAIVEAGERAGQLDGALARLGEFARRRAEARREMLSALIQPAMILLVFVVCVGAVLFLLVPRFQSIYQSFGAALPGPTLVLLTISHSAVRYSYVVALVVVLAVAGWRSARKKVGFRRRVDRVKLSMPVLQGLWRFAALSNIADVMATLVDVGESLAEAVRLAGRAAGDTVHADALEAVRRDITDGMSLGPALKATGVFPDDFLAVVNVAEVSGNLGAQLNHYQEIVTSRLATLRKSLQHLFIPMMTVVLGAGVGATVVCLYLPMFDLAKVIK